jgi:hypothetical protein
MTETPEAAHQHEPLTATPLSTYAAERIVELIRLEALFREALEEIWEAYHFVEGSLDPVDSESIHWERCPGCIAGRALDRQLPGAETS